MSQTEFTVFTAKGQAQLRVSDEGLVLGVHPEEAVTPWERIMSLTRPNPASVGLPLRDGGHLELSFLSREQRDRFATLAAQQQLPGAAIQPPADRPLASKVTLATVNYVPGRRIVEYRGFVTSQSVMSRNLFSDAGSDLKSAFGGTLGGIEKAVGNGLGQARRQLAEAALSVQGDAVVGVTVTIAGLGAKAEAVVMAGTAVKTLSDHASDTEPSANP